MQYRNLLIFLLANLLLFNSAFALTVMTVGPGDIPFEIGNYVSKWETWDNPFYTPYNITTEENVSALYYFGDGSTLDNIVTASNYSTHLYNTSIHFTEANISHLNIQDIGTYSHSELDTHVDNSSIHFEEADIDHTAIQNIGTYTHANIDTHVDNSSIHLDSSKIIQWDNETNLNVNSSIYANYSEYSANVNVPAGTILAYGGDSIPSGVGSARPRGGRKGTRTPWEGPQ